MEIKQQELILPERMNHEPWVSTAKACQGRLCESETLTVEDADHVAKCLETFVQMYQEPEFYTAVQLARTIMDLAKKSAEAFTPGDFLGPEKNIHRNRKQSIYKALEQLCTHIKQRSLRDSSDAKILFANELTIVESELRIIFDCSLKELPLNTVRGFSNDYEIYQKSDFENLRSYSLKNTAAITPIVLALEHQYENAGRIAELQQEPLEVAIGQKLAESVNNRFLRDCWLVISETYRLIARTSLHTDSLAAKAVRSLLMALCRVDDDVYPSMLKARLDCLIFSLVIEGHYSRLECVLRHYGIMIGEEKNPEWLEFVDGCLKLDAPDFDTLHCTASLTLSLALDLKEKLLLVDETREAAVDENLIPSLATLLDKLRASLDFLPYLTDGQQLRQASAGLRLLRDSTSNYTVRVEELAVLTLVVIEALDQRPPKSEKLAAQQALVHQIASVFSQAGSFIERAATLNGRGQRLASEEAYHCLGLFEQLRGASYFLANEDLRERSFSIAQTGHDLLSRETQRGEQLGAEELFALSKAVEKIAALLPGENQHGNGLFSLTITEAPPRELLADDYNGLDQDQPSSNGVDVGGSSSAWSSISDSKKSEGVSEVARQVADREPLGDQVDPEIAEIFIEEAREIFDDFDSMRSSWNLDALVGSPASTETKIAIGEIRRCFHTLKGSGRMAVALHLADVCWSMENMLNRVLDGVYNYDRRHDELLWEAINLLPELLNDFENRFVPVISTRELIERAERFSESNAFGEDQLDSVELDVGLPVTEPVKNQLSELEDILSRLRASAKDYRDGGADVALKSVAIQVHTILGIIPESDDRVLKNIARIADQHLSELLLDSHDREDIADIVDDYYALLSKSTVNPSEALLEQALALRDRTKLDANAEIDACDLQEAIKCSDLLFEVEPLLLSWRSVRAGGESFEQLVFELDRLITAKHVPSQIITLLQSLSRVYKLIENRSLSFSLFKLLQRAHEDLENQLSARLIDQPIEYSGSSALLDKYCEDQKQKIDSLQEGDAFDQSQLDVEGAQDEEIVAIFRDELSDLIEQLQDCHSHWDNGNRAVQLLKPMLRPLHTVKGSARMASVDAIARMAHDLETSIQHLLDHQNSDNTSNRERIHDAFESFLDLCKTFMSGTLPAVVSRQGLMIERRARDRGLSSSAPRETVKVPAQVLDRLNNLADENSVSRSVIEQRIVDFSESFEEVDNTLMRLREQLRHLDIETDAQIGSRNRLFHGGDVEGFDPLEFDRYSKLQQLSRSLTESSSDLKDLYSTMRENVRNVETMLAQQSRITREMQQSLQQTRTVSLSKVLIPRMKRTLVGLSEELSKPVSLSILNVDGELDKRILDRLVAPLEHILRNAIDHGIETAAERQANGKSAQGLICVDISRKGSELQIDIQDDGKGLDVDAIARKAVEKGLVSADQELEASDALQLIFEPGFSTAEQLTQISGRGVGLDVVATELKQMGGAVSARSEPGKGTTFTMRIPFNVSLNRALLVNCGSETFAIPLESLQGIVRVSSFELEELYEDPSLSFNYAGQDYDFRYLGAMLQEESSQFKVDEYSAVPVLLARAGNKPVAFQVDKLMGSREVVLKTLGPRFKPVPGIAGATILGDGSVVTILDLPELYRVTAQRKVTALPSIEGDTPVSSVCCHGLVVDDSVTVRKVTSRLLERLSITTQTAKDGLDAMSIMEGYTPDFVLLDVEMPRLDGFEVLSRMRKDERLAHVPVIMISSRSGSKHKLRAADLGANAFIGKPYQDLKLCSTIAEHCEKFADHYFSSSEEQRFVGNG